MTKLLSPLINALIDRRVSMIVEATSRLFDQVVRDPEGLYQQMVTWQEVQPADLEAYRRAFVDRARAAR